MYDTIFKDADIYLIELIYKKKPTLLRSLLYLYIKRRIIFLSNHKTCILWKTREK